MTDACNHPLQDVVKSVAAWGSFGQSVIDAMPVHVAVVNDRGIIIGVNRAWVRFAAENGLPDTQRVCEGVDYLAVCRRAADMKDPLADEALAGIQAVLQGRMPFFTLDYPCHSPTQQRWFTMDVCRCLDVAATVIVHVNITGRKQAEDECRETRERFRLIAASTPDHLIVQDVDLRYTMVINPQLGLTEKDMLGKTDFDLLPQEDAQRLTAIKRKVLGTGESLHVELPIASKKTPAEFFEGAYVPRFDAQGKIDGVIGYLRNVTDRTRAMQALQKSEEKFRLAFESSPVGMAMCEMDGSFVEANQAYLNIIGYTREEALKLSYWDVTPREYAEDEARQLRSMEETGKYGPYEKEYIRKDGQRVPVLLNGMVVFSDGVRRIWSLVTDITERRRTEESLRQSEARYRALVELSPDAIFVNRNDRIELVNPAALQLFGAAAPQQVLGKPPLAFFHRDDHEVVRERIRTILAGQSVPLREEKVVRLNGEVRIAEVAASPFVDLNGTAIQVFLRDITERKRAENELRQTAENLRRSNRDLEQFAYVASHDLQEPLRMVTSYMDLLASGYKGRLDKDADEFIAFAVEGAHRMQQLISDLLAYSRITSATQLGTVSVQAAFDRAMADLRGMIAQTGARITHDPLPEVLADEGQLTQLLTNLLSNAMKFRSDRPPQIHLGVRREAAEWIFSVRDNGIGFAPASIERIFQLFQRLHTRQKYPGSGIGLAICKKIVERHGGRIWAESQVGQGSTFFFTMPA